MRFTESHWGLPADVLDHFGWVFQSQVQVTTDLGGGPGGPGAFAPDAPGRPASRLASLKQGQFFGEMAILRDSPRTATVRAITPTTLLTMDRDVFRNLVAQSLATTEDFDRVIRQRLAELASRPL